MPAADLPLLIDAIRVAGRVAASYTGPTAKLWTKPDGAGPVTEADLAVNDVLHQILRCARPDYGWLSEETEDTQARLDRDTVFIVDPIDGTRSFVEGGRTWAISIAVAQAGEITAGAVLLPLRDLLYTAARGAGAALNGAPLSVTSGALSAASTVLAAKPNFDTRNWRGPVPEVARHYRPSLAYRLALVGAGRFDAMLTLRPSWEWDIAAGALIVSEAGGRITDRTGAPLRFNSARAALNGVVAAGPTLHPALLAQLAPAP